MSSPIAGNQSFTNVVYQAGVVNSEPNLPSTINMENAPIVDAFGRNIHVVKLYTPTNFASLVQNNAVSLMTVSGVAAGSAATDGNVFNLPVGAKVIGALITATTAIAPTTPSLALAVGAINNISVTNLVMGTATVANLGLGTADASIMVGGGGGVTVGGTGASAPAGTPATGAVDQANSCVNVIETNVAGPVTAGALEVILQYVDGNQYQP
tara:strand:- start:587 stop:1219 length:633 start_codon:yes stop_codon:yes gene_type:complete